MSWPSAVDALQGLGAQPIAYDPMLDDREFTEVDRMIAMPQELDYRITMTTALQKDQAHKLIDQLPPNATWDDLIREIYVRQAVEQGLADSQAGRTKSVQEVRSKYGLTE